MKTVFCLFPQYKEFGAILQTYSLNIDFVDKQRKGIPTAVYYDLGKNE